jgi:hypothetical protein
LFQLAGNKRHIQEVGNFGRLPKEKKKKKTARWHANWATA